LERLGKNREALEQSKEAKKLNPRAPEVRYQLYRQLRRLGQETEAKREIQQFEAMRQHERDQFDANRLHTEALQSLEGGNAVKAAELFRRAIALKPANAKLHYNLALTLAELGDRAAQEQELIKAVELDPNLAQAHYHLGMLAKESGTRAESEREFRTSLAIEPQYADARFQIGGILLDLGQEDEAVNEWKAVLEQNPEHLLSLYALARALEARRSPDARAYEDRLWELQKKSGWNSRANLLKGVADAAAVARDWGLARASLKEALQLCGRCDDLAQSPLWQRLRASAPK
jgi:tetratricopeptide (TPR) repeat protein